MRIRIDAVSELTVAREARLSLLMAGFIVVEGDQEADYIIGLVENEDRHATIEIAGADGTFERLAINRLAAQYPRLVLDRSEPPNDQVLRITIPPVDGVRRAVSRALVEIFLTFLAGPSAPTRIQQGTVLPTVPTSPIEHAQAWTSPSTLLAPTPDPTIDLLTRRLVDLTGEYGKALEARAEAREGAAFRTADAHVVTFLNDTRQAIEILSRAVVTIADGIQNLQQRLSVERPWWQVWGRRG